MIIYSKTLKSKPFLLDFIASGLKWKYEGIELSQVNSRKDFIVQHLRHSDSPLQLTKRVLRYPLQVIYGLGTIKDQYCSHKLLDYLAKETALLEGSFNPHIVSRSSVEILNYLFTCYYKEQFRGQAIDEQVLQDYLHITLINEATPNIKIRSFKRLINEHDRLVEELAYTNLPDFTIPDAGLLSPSENGYVFQCICTKQQLLEEAKEMRHCVAIYASDISSGESVIYSISGKERATAEFSDLGNGYCLMQVKSYHNKEVSKNLTKLLENRISRCEKRGPQPSSHFNFNVNEIPF